jgi:5-(carboxyamino)imidazole ribonucleotide mutase
MVKHPLVGIIMGSDSDWPVLRVCAETLKEFGVPYEAKVLSAHRTPDAALDYAASAAERGMKVPMPSRHLQGLDSLLAMVQMPGGIPVATFAIGEAGAMNAALFAVSMLALNDASLAQKLSDFRVRQTEKVLAKTLPDMP